MKFEVINRHNVTVMFTEEVKYIPTPAELKLMSEAGYKFKIDEKSVTLKQLKEFLNK